MKVTTGKFNGPISKTATVTTNCTGTMATLTLKLEGEVWLPIACTPNTATFGTITSDQAGGPPLERHVTIVNNLEAPATIKELKCTSPVFRLETKELEPGKKWDLLVTALTPLNPGNNYGQISFKTDLADMPDVTLAATAYVAPDVDFTPTQVLVMPMANQTQPIVRQVTVRNNKLDTPLTISDLACSNPEAKVTMKEQTPGRIFQLTVELPATVKPGPAVAPLSPGSAGDKITFKTNNPKHAEVSIPLIVRAAPTPPAPGTLASKTMGPVLSPTAAPPGQLPSLLSPVAIQPQPNTTAGPTGAQPGSPTVQQAPKPVAPAQAALAVPIDGAAAPVKPK